MTNVSVKDHYERQNATGFTLLILLAKVLPRVYAVDVMFFKFLIVANQQCFANLNFNEYKILQGNDVYFQGQKTIIHENVNS